MLLAIVVPMRNEANGLGEFCQSLFDELSILDHRFEVFIVDDHSTDQTKELLFEAGAHVPANVQFKYISSPLRSGKIRAQAAAFPYITNSVELVLFMDGDGQHDVKQVRKLLLAAMASGSSVVGSRTEYKRSKFSALGVKAFGAVMELLGVDNDSELSEFLVLNQQDFRTLASSPALGTLPLFALLESNSISLQKEFVTIRDSIELNRKSRFSAHSLIRLGVLGLFKNPSAIFGRIALLTIMFGLLVFAYAIFIGVQRFLAGDQNGVASLLLSQTLWSTIIMSVSLLNTLFLLVIWSALQRLPSALASHLRLENNNLPK